ncbi:MAG: hypothetical protein IT454_06450 [Planctomycetes bacterium]|nr:hypothetical protein [Planctomycetota bacterium]
MNAWSSKSMRAALWYVAFCAVAYFVAQRQLLGLCSDERHAVVRELVRGEQSAEVLFIGSSQTARGVVPAVFDARASELAGREVRSLNLSTLGNARHIAFLTLEKWLEHHEAPRAVYIDCGVTSDLPEYPHETLARFMDASDALRVLGTHPYLARDHREFARRQKDPPLVDPLGLFRELDRRTLHLELALDVLGRGAEDCVRAAFNAALNSAHRPYWKPGVSAFDEVVAAQVAERGFLRIAPDSLEGQEGKLKLAAQAARVSFEDAVAAQWKGEDEFASPERFAATREYAVELARLCRAHGIRLVFLDQPNFRGRPLRPSQIEFYESLAELCSQDKSVLYREESFQDPGHLSVQGAEFASRALAEHYVRSAR